MAAVAEDAAAARGARGPGGVTPRPLREVFLFALRAIAWSVGLFALWYLAARPLGLALGWGASRLLEAAAPVERARPRWSAPGVAFDIELDGSATYRAGLRPDAVFEIRANPLKQSFGLPFFFALLLASRPARAARKALLGAFILAALAAVGLASELALDLARLDGAGGARLVDLGSVGASAAALGFQLGTLIFPTVVPVMLWAAMDSRSLNGRVRANDASP